MSYNQTAWVRFSEIHSKNRKFRYIVDQFSAFSRCSYDFGGSGRWERSNFVDASVWLGRLFFVMCLHFSSPLHEYAGIGSSGNCESSACRARSWAALVLIIVRNMLCTILQLCSVDVISCTIWGLHAVSEFVSDNSRPS